MRIAESVTFGGSGLDRAAAFRGDAARLGELRADPAARACVWWRGKPLLAGDALGFVAPDHPALADQGEGMVFLGLDDGAPRFAADISGWEPPEVDPAELGRFFDATEQAHPAFDGMRFAELRAVMARLTPREAELAAMARALLGWHAHHGFCAKCGARSDWAMAGWQRDCPACGAHHFPRTDPVVIMLITRGNSVLMGRSPGWPEGMYSLLAGFVEPGETIEAAVRREVAEESGVKVGAVRYLASQPWPFPASLMLGCQGDAESDAITIDPAEIEDALWLTREEMVGVMAGLHPRIKPSRRGAIAHFLIANWLADRLD
ncbi:MAG: NAD(+) diphosphatase [Rhodobacteraceae bacterium]|nr:NAD(+) diphosphatase [Paracoccaceae bacterium]